MRPEGHDETADSVALRARPQGSLYRTSGSVKAFAPALSTCSVWRASEIIQCVVEEGRSVLSGGSGCGGPPGDFIPGTEAVGHLAAVFLGVEQVTTGPEVR